MPTKFFGTVRQKIFDGNLWYPLLCIKIFDTPKFQKHWRGAHEIFRHCETKNFRRKHVIPPFMHKNFPIPQTFWNIEGMPTKFFSTVRQNFFDGNLWYPFLCIKFFDTPNFLKHWRDAHKIFRHCETKTFLRKIVIPSIMHKIFPIPQTFWNIEGMPTKFFSTVRQNFFDGNLWYPLLCTKFFRYPKLSETLKGCPRNFSALWDKNFSTETCDTPYYAQNFSDTPNFLKHWRDAHEIFQHCETKIFRRKLVIPSIMHETFRYPNFFRNIEGMPTKFFGTVRQKIFDGNLWYPLLCIKIFDTPKFRKHWRGAHEIFRHCETKNFRRKHVIPPFMHKNFPIPQTFWNIEGMPTKFFSTVRQNFFDGNLWYPFLCIKFFDTPNFLKHWRDAHKIFRHCETKTFRRKIVIPSIMHKIFPIPQTFWNIEGMPTKIFSTVRQNFFDGNLWYPLLCTKFFRYPKLSETLKGCPRNFSALWDKKFSTETCDTPYYA